MCYFLACRFTAETWNRLERRSNTHHEQLRRTSVNFRLKTNFLQVPAVACQAAFSPQEFKSESECLLSKSQRTTGYVTNCKSRKCGEKIMEKRIMQFKSNKPNLSGNQIVPFYETELWPLVLYFEMNCCDHTDNGIVSFQSWISYKFQITIHVNNCTIFIGPIDAVASLELFGITAPV